MLDLLTGLFNIISGFLANIDSFFTSILNYSQIFIDLIIRADDVFSGTFAYFPAYLSIPCGFLLMIVVALRVWSIITSGG